MFLRVYETQNHVKSESTAAVFFPAGKSLQENGLIQAIWIKRRNTEQKRYFEDWEPLLSQPGLSLTLYAEGSASCSWEGWSCCSTGTEPAWLARMHSSQPAPGEGTAREQQPTWAACVSAVAATAIQRPLPLETAPLMASRPPNTA